MSMHKLSITEDTLYDEAVEYVCKKEYISIADLQRKFRIGYYRADALMEKLDKEGIIDRCGNGYLPRVIGKIDSPKRVQKDNWDQLWTDHYGEYNNLTRHLLKLCFSDRIKDNLIISPLSIYIALSMLASSTAGTTREEILTKIAVDADYCALKERVQALLDYMGSERTLRVANAVCVNERVGKSLKSEYSEEIKSSYSGELFSSSSDVNNWVSKKTDGMIEKVMDESTANLIACLINAVAFESKWEKQYREDDIWEEDFSNVDRSKRSVQMLHSTEQIYIENDLLTGFRKNYKSSKYSFMGLLPKKRGPSQILKCLRDINFTELYEAATYEVTAVSIPEFDYSSTISLSEYCKEMGILQAFTPDADFSAMGNEWIKTEEIIHSARIELDRHGTKAAAVTMIGLGAGGILWEPKTVELNRPFIYAIMHNDTKLPVFVGVVNHL